LDPTANKTYVCSAALDAGFTRARIFAPFEPEALLRQNGQSQSRINGAKSLLVCALPYGNRHEPALPCTGDCYGTIAPFARFNYYREAVKRMKRLSRILRTNYGGIKSDYRIFCNSSIPEKPIAAASGLGLMGRNSLIISPEAGSLFIIAAMTLPLALEADPPLASDPDEFPLCKSCGKNPPCAAACPTGAVLANGHIDRGKCIQWYASGNSPPKLEEPCLSASNLDLENIPAPVRAAWGRRLYGCVSCQEACIHNKRSIQGVQTEEGALPAFINIDELLGLSDLEIKEMFKGTAMGLSWLGPRAIRRNAEMVLAGALNRENKI
jgi:epoxyqueuosine reductase